jgi:hypothetical protein
VIELFAPLADMAQIAHDTMVPHQEPVKGSSGGAPTIVILVGVVVTLAAVAGLVWLKKRTTEEE